MSEVIIAAKDIKKTYRRGIFRKHSN